MTTLTMKRESLQRPGESFGLCLPPLEDERGRCLELVKVAWQQLSPYGSSPNLPNLDPSQDDKGLSFFTVETLVAEKELWSSL